MKYDSDLIEATYLIQKSNPELAKRIWDRLIPKVEIATNKNDLYVGFGLVVPEHIVKYIQREYCQYDKIIAIKAMREQTGWGLKNAKDAIELMINSGLLK